MKKFKKFKLAFLLVPILVALGIIYSTQAAAINCDIVCQECGSRNVNHIHIKNGDGGAGGARASYYAMEESDGDGYISYHCRDCGHDGIIPEKPVN